jgi:hypothetical protein
MLSREQTDSRIDMTPRLLQPPLILFRSPQPPLRILASLRLDIFVRTSQLRSTQLALDVSAEPPRLAEGFEL